jgi:hypothetical protein
MKVWTEIVMRDAPRSARVSQTVDEVSRLLSASRNGDFLSLTMADTSWGASTPMLLAREYVVAVYGRETL